MQTELSAPAVPATNGHSASPVPAPYTPPVRYADLTLTDDYAGAWVRMRINPTVAQRRRFFSGEEDETRDALVELITAWNLSDSAGGVLPITAESMDAVPEDLLSAVITAWIAERRRPLAEPTATSATSPSA